MDGAAELRGGAGSPSAAGSRRRWRSTRPDAAVSGYVRFFRALCFLALLSGCSEPPPVRINLAALSEYQTDVDGRHVVVRGTVRTVADPRHYWIENDDLDRVALEGADELAPLVGRTVEVRGVFRYDPYQGRRIEVIELTAAP